MTRKNTCNFCHKNGYWKVYCPGLKDKSSENSYNVDDNVNVIENDFGFCPMCWYSSDNVWILDLGCSYHSALIWIVSYIINLLMDKFFMGNNFSRKVVGIGTVRIKMHDGVTRTLTNVRHVPNLKRDLIFWILLALLVLSFPYIVEF